jgi:WhiB family redox-sensing transcriptional regulator
VSDYFEDIAAGLDLQADVPDDVLWERVTTDGECMRLYVTGQAPEFSGDVHSDRELAARVCAGCPVRGECLEVEFRTAGHLSLGVWGALNEEDRRAVYPLWLARRERRGRE